MLGTPPAFILSQDQTLLFNLWFRSTLVNLSRFYCLLGFVPSVLKTSGTVPLNNSFWNFQGCITVYLSRCLRFLIGTERRRRDLNPRAAINDLHPFQGCPFGLLGTSPSGLNHQPHLFLLTEYGPAVFLGEVSPAERVGFEPTRPCGQTVFKTASL